MFESEGNTISFKQHVSLHSKKTSCHLFGKEHHLFEGKASLMKKEIESAVLLFEYHFFEHM